MKFFIPFIVSVFLCLSLVGVSMAETSGLSFHPPQTEAEKALDKILILNADKNFDLYSFVFDYPDRNKAQDDQLLPLFSAGFLKRHAAEEKALITESCGGVFPEDGQPCDMIRSINPIVCAQDRPDTYLYYTVFQDNKKAVVFYAWPETGALYAEGPSYTLIFDKGRWVLDVTSCEGLTGN